MTGHRTAPRRRGANIVSSLGRLSANGRAAGSTGTSGRGLPTKKSNISICAPTRHSFCSSRIICPNFITAPCMPLLTLPPCLSARDRGRLPPQAHRRRPSKRFAPWPLSAPLAAQGLRCCEPQIKIKVQGYFAAVVVNFYTLVPAF